MDRPITTLFMLMSVDGKISTGATDELDVDRDFPGIPGLREGLHQYYEIEQTTDLWSFNTGRVQAWDIHEHRVALIEAHASGFVTYAARR